MTKSLIGIILCGMITLSLPTNAWSATASFQVGVVIPPHVIPANLITPNTAVAAQQNVTVEQRVTKDNQVVMIKSMVVL